MRHFILLVSALVCCLAASAQPKVSIFLQHIEDIASQENISFREAATIVRNLGYEGVEVLTTTPDEKMAVLDELGFAHSCAIIHMDYYNSDEKELEATTVSFLNRHKYERFLLVPGLRPENAQKNSDAKFYARVKAFAKKLTDMGLDVMFEDFDNMASPIRNIEGLDRMFEQVPFTFHCFDTGNFIFSGEDALEAYEHFKARIKHVHLKDRLASDGDRRSPAVGTGIVPMTEIIQRIVKSGYNGWLVVEHFDSKHQLRDATLSIRFVKTAIQSVNFAKQEGMKPGMTEYWAPQPKLVDPGKCSADAPSDAIVLFDGKDLSQWVDAKGNDASWPVHDGVMTVDKKKGDIITKQKFGSFQLHIEWSVPSDITGSNQARGNSGIYMQDMYEVQVLDSYENPTYVDGQAGSIYKQTPPLVNAMRKPGDWNVYDIIYTAPVFKEDGTYLYHPYVTVIHNGVIVQNHTEIQGTTEYIGLPVVKKHGDGPVRIQSHGDPSAPISFRNIWIRKL